MWSTQARTVWGKLDPESTAWLPLVTHLEDAHAVAGLLWDHFLPASVKLLLCESVGVSDVQGRALVRWLAGTHDVGKASPDFAHQAEGAGAAWVLDRMRDVGLATTRPQRKIGHATVGQIAAHDWLVARYDTQVRAANTWSCVIGGHHGRNPAEGDITYARSNPTDVGVGAWVDVRYEILDTMVELTGPDLDLKSWTQRRLPVPAQTLLTAIVVMADWIASNQDLFPYQDPRDASTRAASAYDQLDLPGPWTPPIPTDTLTLFQERFPSLGAAEPHAIQDALLTSALTCGPGSLHIVEAKMGDGKTEAAFLAVEALCSRFGQGGMFMGLPTMATANPMFARTLDWLSTSLGSDGASVALAHGKAGLNERYTGLPQRTKYGPLHDDDHPTQGLAIANGWLRGRRKAGLSSFVTGTIDQSLFLGLKAKHVLLRHLAMAGKVVVIDEVHAADTYMREYLKRVLTWLGAYQTPVILMSATLPPDQRDEYVAAYAAGRGEHDLPSTGTADTYPRITRYDGVLTDVLVPSSATPALTVKVQRIADDSVILSSLLSELLIGGGCIGVICNTVGRAQETFRALQQHFGTDVVLMHSRFLAPHRASREKALVEQLGREGDRPTRLIVVGTQVLEQSLDVDFDAMVTDLAPIDLVLQRMGRLHRHAGRKRPAQLETPTVYLRGVENWEESPPVAVRGSRTVYGEAPLLRAAAVLDDRHELELPTLIPSLVRRAYDPDIAAPSGWEACWVAAEKRADAVQARATDRAQTFLLKGPSVPSSLTGFLDVNVGDPERQEREGRSQVRDSEDSLEVIALWRDPSGRLHLPDCAPAHAGAEVPEGHPWGMSGSEYWIAKAMASCTVSLPRQLVHPRVIDKTIGELEQMTNASGWQKSPWISGQLVLVFDEDDRAHLAGFDLQYSNDEGLLVTKPEDHS